MSISKKIKSFKNQIACWWLHRGRYKFRRFFHPNLVFFVLSCDHGNLGDHAIAYAAKKLLEEANVQYFEITNRNLYAIANANGTEIFKGRAIFINGGGNLGTLWPEAENVMRNLVKYNPDSPMAIFPNSIYYEDNEAGRAELEESVKIYNEHKNLRMYAREQLSYDFMKDVYNDVSLVPDLVLSLNKSGQEVEREGCILCLRNDLEKTMSENAETEIVTSVARIFGENVARFDTVKEYDIGIKERESELEKAFGEFHRAKLVITDRLHGMIFAAITGTPCIVINSRSPKVRGCYEWIKHLEYIKFCDDVSKIEELYCSIPAGPHRYDNTNLQPYYDELRKDIKQKAKRRR